MRKAKESQTAKNAVAQKSSEFVFELSLEFEQITPTKDGNRKKVKTEVRRLADGFSAKDASKQASKMLFAVSVSEKDENGKIVNKPLARSTCKTVYTLYYAIVKKEIEKSKESVVSERRKLFSFEKSLNSSYASVGRWLNEIKPYLKAAFQDCELPGEAKVYFDAMNEYRKLASERAKKVQQLKQAAKGKTARKTPAQKHQSKKQTEKLAKAS